MKCTFSHSREAATPIFFECPLKETKGKINFASGV